MAMEWPAWWGERVLGVTVFDYVEAALVALGVWIVLYALRRALYHVLRRLDFRHTVRAKELMMGLLDAVRPGLFPLFGLLAGLHKLGIHGSAAKTLKATTMALVVYQVVLVLQRLVSYFVMGLDMGEKGRDLKSRNFQKNLVVISSGALWVAALLFLMDNVGINISTFVAGLGVGGIAVALAAQAILGDAFSSFILAIDKPFEVGDYVSVDNFEGTVESVGLKTTRVRGLGGELLVFANSDLTKSRIRNFKRMRERRVAFTLGITYDTPRDALAAIPGIMESIITAKSPVRFDRAHVVGIGTSSIDVEVVYWVLVPDVAVFRGIHQAVILETLAAFEGKGISLAFPTRTIVMANGDADRAAQGRGARALPVT